MINDNDPEKTPVPEDTTPDTPTALWSPWMHGQRHTVADPAASGDHEESTGDAGLLSVFLGFSS
jgi:hypothetical protein